MADRIRESRTHESTESQNKNEGIHRDGYMFYADEAGRNPGRNRENDITMEDGWE